MHWLVVQHRGDSERRKKARLIIISLDSVVVLQLLHVYMPGPVGEGVPVLANGIAEVAAGGLRRALSVASAQGRLAVVECEAGSVETSAKALVG